MAGGPREPGRPADRHRQRHHHPHHRWGPATGGRPPGRHAGPEQQPAHPGPGHHPGRRGAPADHHPHRPGRPPRPHAHQRHRRHASPPGIPDKEDETPWATGEIGQHDPRPGVADREPVPAAGPLGRARHGSADRRRPHRAGRARPGPGHGGRGPGAGAAGWSPLHPARPARLVPASGVGAADRRRHDPGHRPRHRGHRRGHSGGPQQHADRGAAGRARRTGGSRSWNRTAEPAGRPPWMGHRSSAR